PGDVVQYSDHVEGHGPAFYRQACRLGLEGIISKRRDAPYRPGRGREWLKVKCLREQEFVIVGYTAPQGARTGFGALWLASHDDDGRRLQVGKVGTGFDTALLRTLHRRLRSLEVDEPPVANPPRVAAARGVRWVAPPLVAAVGVQRWGRSTCGARRGRRPVVFAQRHSGAGARPRRRRTPCASPVPHSTRISPKEGTWVNERLARAVWPHSGLRRRGVQQ